VVESPLLDGTSFAEIPVFGRPLILLAISDVVLAVADLEVLAIGGQVRAFDFYRRT
jgi:hypothetical protein